MAVGTVVVVLAAGVGVFGMTQTTSSSGPSVAPQPGNPPEDGSAGMVVDLQTSEGMRIFGLMLRPDTYWANVGFVVPEECLSRDASGHEVLLREGLCAALPVHGELSGSGTTATGSRLAFVRVKVSRPCFDALTAGDRWPPEAGACADD